MQPMKAELPFSGEKRSGKEKSKVVEVSTLLSIRDRLRHWGYRWGIGRMSAEVLPGLYQVGAPDGKSPVLVSANYRLSFDILRSVLGGRNAWLLVLDTKGINVWCAAGKGTFGTEELVKRIEQHNIKNMVSHRRVIVPQLGAPGVAAHEVKKLTGFTVSYGPVRARDLPVFLDRNQATPAMRRVTFNLGERLAVVPIELIPAFFPVLLISLGIALAAGWQLGMAFFMISISAPLAIPVFHNWLPGTWLSIKGSVWGALAAVAAVGWLAPGSLKAGLLFLSAMATASYLALNFTGATTYTSVNGVKREMKHMLPVIISTAGLALLGWVYLAVRRFMA